MRTQPHVLQAVRDNASTSSKNIYHTMITAAEQNAAPAPVTSAPRNVEEIRNTKKIQRNQARPSHDALYNVHELAYDSNCIHRIVTYPDLSGPVPSSRVKLTRGLTFDLTLG